MPELEARDGADSVENVLTEFDGRYKHFEELCKETEKLVRRILELENIQVQSIQSRVKRRKKVESKYRDPEKDYKCLSDMPDVVGLRIITYYSDEIDRVAAVIKREFKPLNVDDKRVGKPGVFGYTALHLDCKYSSSRLLQTEYKPFAGSRFEVQVTTVLGHAWAEMQHGPYDDKDSSPPDEQRAFFRLAAVLELTDKEFLAARKERENRQLNASVRVAAMSPSIEISAASVSAFVQETPTAIEIDEELAKVLGRELDPVFPSLNAERLAKLAREAGFGTVQEIEQALMKTRTALSEYLARFILVRRTGQIQDFTRKVRKGLSIFHLASFYFAIQGLDVYLAHFRSPLPKQVIEEQIRIAREVAATHGIVAPAIQPPEGPKS